MTSHRSRLPRLNGSEGVSAVATAGAGELRGLMVDQLKKRGLEFDPAIEAAFRAVPREAFVPNVPLEQVYACDVIVTKRDAGGEPISSSRDLGSQDARAQLRD